MHTIDLNLQRVSISTKHINTLITYRAVRSFLMGACVTGPEASFCYATVVSLSLSLSLSLFNSLLPVTVECLLCWWILSLLYCLCSLRSDKRHTPSPSFTHWVMRSHLSPPFQRWYNPYVSLYEHTTHILVIVFRR